MLRPALLLNVLFVLAAVCSLPAPAQQNPVPPAPTAGARLANYNQWRLALSGVAGATEITAPAGFRVEVLLTAAADEGSWISLAWDAKRRLIVGREDQGLLRASFTENLSAVARLETVNSTLHEPRGLLFAHDALYVTANNDRAIYRLRDADGDDRWDEPELLRRLEGGVGHGRNGLALGPDGKIYLACGNNVRVPGDVSPQSPYANYGLDRLPPCAWNKFLFDADVSPPAGFIARMDARGENFELVAGGFRNPYDLAFSAAGDLFTYDADMEWDVGAPWYRPTTVMHVVPGGEYGWRQGSSVWPDAFPDALPRVCDIGLGSPTGVVLGERARFPARYKNALFILDWAYGRILAVHLSPHGASYRGTVEPFVQGRPLNVTDAAIGPDGALYFLVGGRRTQSALYRVSYVGDEPASAALPDSPAPPAEAATDRQQAAQLRALPRGDPAAIKQAWPQLAHNDAYVRQAARNVLESLPPAAWTAALAEEASASIAAEALLALARTEPRDPVAAVLPTLGARLSEKKLAPPDRIVMLRALAVALGRQQPPLAESTAAQLKRLLEPLARELPVAAPLVERQLLLEVLVALDSSAAPAFGVAQWQAGGPPREQLLWLHLLRNQRSGWNDALRGAYLAGLKAAEKFPGAQYLPRFVTYIRSDAVRSLTPAERETFAVELSELGADEAGPVAISVNRPLVKVWQLADLQGLVGKSAAPGAVARGEKLYRETLCIRCHRWNGAGGLVGPDLTNVAGRFGRKELLEAIVEPSRVVEDKYRTLLVGLKDGRQVSGLLVGGGDGELLIAPNHFQPAQFVRVREDEVAERGTSLVSLMPLGLLNTLTEAEVLDLLSFLESGVGLEMRPPANDNSR